MCILFKRRIWGKVLGGGWIDRTTNNKLSTFNNLKTEHVLGIEYLSL